MRLVSYVGQGESARHRRLGVLVAPDVIGDVRAAAARLLYEEEGDLQADAIAAVRVPGDCASLLQGGPQAMALVNRTAAYLTNLARHDRNAKGMDGESLFIPYAEARLFAPLKPTKVIAAGRNYGKHLQEMSGSKLPYVLPSTWLKGPHAVIGPNDDLVRPKATNNLDYETEFAFVIGRSCKNVPEAKAFDYIAGYTIANDITARDVGRLERAEGNRLLAKSFDGFCPLGPVFVTKDEIPDPYALTIKTRVNGDQRQEACTGDMIWKLPQILAYVSQIQLNPGDVITTGSPEGVAMGKGGLEGSKFMKPGDILESEVTGIGIMRNRIVDDPLEPSWNWKKG